MNRIWLDITNTPQVHFLTAIYNELRKNKSLKFLFSTREFAETTDLLQKKIGDDFRIFGSHYGKSKVKKVTGLIKRFKNTLNSNLEYDISISCGSEAAIWKTYINRKHSIAFGDNDLARQWTYGHFVDYAFFPDAIESKKLTRQGIRRKRLFLYPGYKEDVYLANYIPDEEFKKNIPFDEYIIVRPENISANYIQSKKINTITPALLKSLSNKGYNIIYLPRYQHDNNFAADIKNIHIPEKAINGLDACYFSNAVLTGAGTLAREAACLGIPSFSFFAGKDLLAVDKKLIKEGKMFFSRDPDELVKKVISSRKNMPETNRSKEVKKQIIDKLEDVIKNFGF